MSERLLAQMMYTGVHTGRFLAIIDKKGKIVLNRLEKAVGIQMRTPGLDGREAYRLSLIHILPQWYSITKK